MLCSKYLAAVVECPGLGLRVSGQEVDGAGSDQESVGCFMPEVDLTPNKQVGFMAPLQLSPCVQRTPGGTSHTSRRILSKKSPMQIALHDCGLSPPGRAAQNANGDVAADDSVSHAGSSGGPH